MWKKIGAIGPTSNDNKSNRSKDQNFHQQPFSQMTKARMSQSQIFFQNNDYFFPNFIQKAKQPEISKIGSQLNTKFSKLQQVRSCNNLSSEYPTAKKLIKTLNQYELQQLNNKLNYQNLEDTNLSANKGTKQFNEQQINMTTLSTQKISSSTSIDGDMKKLNQCKSTPQIHFKKIDSITQQISLDKKIQTKNNLEKLKKQHKQVKKTLETKLADFSQDFKSMQNQIKQQLSKVILQNQKSNNTVQNMKNQNQPMKIKSMNFQAFVSQTVRFGEKLKTINQKKAELLEKYKSLRVK